MKYDVAVLGADGLLGQELMTGLKDGHQLIGSSRRPGEHSQLSAASSDDDLISFFRKLTPDGIVINAIGKLAQNIDESNPQDVEEAIVVNSLFPRRLSRLTSNMGLRLVHISTDAVFSKDVDEVNENSQTSPDGVYGLSKLIGESVGKNVINIRCSFIGCAETKKKSGMWSWILGLNAGAEISGYQNHSWAGVTTRQLVQLCDKLTDKDIFYRLSSLSSIHHFCPNEVISKYQLARIISSCCRPDIGVKAQNASNPVTRILTSKFNALNELVKRNQSWHELIMCNKAI
jgi:dTDP-4-dehydrorhamnose reductase